MSHELTRQDIEKMEQEIEHRKLVVRKQLLEDVRTAREQGDLSENFEYYAAKKAKNQNEGRIRFLDRMIRTANVIEDETEEDEIGVNKTVTLLMEDDGSEEVYKLVTTMRSNTLNGLISIEAPLGKSLLGHKVGDRILIKVNETVNYYVKVLKIENTEETNDELNRY